MKVEKRNQYRDELILNGIHTLSGFLPGNVDEIPEQIKDNIGQCNYRSKANKTYVKINPNKSVVGEKLIITFSRFIWILELILEALGHYNLDDLDITRCDFCYNSPDRDSFNNYNKVHKLIISLLAKAYRFKNCYKAADLWDEANISMAIKKNDAEIENYDKRKESNGKSECCNRLELRSKRMNDTIQSAFLIDWFRRLDVAKGYFSEVQKEYNTHLSQLYLDDLKKDKEDRRYLSLTSFLLQYKDSIFCRKQMINLLRRIGVKNPTKTADRFKEKHHIEYFSQTDINEVINVLKEKMIEYFSA